MSSVNSTCIWFELDSEGNILKKEFAWPDPYDRQGDGESELDAFLECSRDNGFPCIEVDDLDVYYNGGKVRVFKYEYGEEPQSAVEELFFGLLVEDVNDEYSKEILLND